MRHRLFLLSSRAMAGLLQLLFVVAVTAYLTGTASADPAPKSHFAPARLPHKVIFYPTLPNWRSSHRTGSPRVSGSGDLVYNGGSVLENPVSYVVFWGSYWNNGSGGVTPDAQVVLKYFNDMGTTQFENILTQYSDKSSHIANTNTFAGYWNDTSVPPTDTACSSNPTIEDSSIANEVTHAISVNGWPTDATNAVYFVYTPPNYAVHAGGGCSGQTFCAYHTWNTVSYAAEPYPVLSVCPALQSPNGNAAGDSLANTSSHEQFESISDPFPCGYGCSATGWIDSANYEIGDKCAWNFDGGTTNMNNGGVFYVQTEYSNASHSCVNAYNSSPHMRLLPTSLSLTVTAGTNPGQQQVGLENTTWNTLTWSAASLPSWVTVNPTSGSIAGGTTQQLSFTFNLTSPLPQTYSTQLALSGNADNSPINLPISVTTQGGTLHGQVYLWPSTPVCNQSSACITPLAQRQVAIYTSGSSLLTTVSTDQQGNFSVALPPGIVVAKVVLGGGPQVVRQVTDGRATVTVGQTSQVTILVDTGVR